MILSFSFPNRLARRHKRVLALLTIIPPLVLLPGSLSQFWPISKAALHSFRSDTISSSTQVTSSNHNKNPSVIRLSGHQRIEGGRLRVSLGGTHPFHDLIADAEVRWNNMLESQSATLDAAIKVYQHRYGRRPPVGFDKWYEFARSVNFKLIDEFDQINRDISPLLALPNRVLQQRLDLVSKESHSYHLAVKHGKTSIAGPLARWEIPARLQNLVSDFAEDLPDLTIYVSGHDVGPTILGEDMRIAVDAVLRSGQQLNEEWLTELETLERNPRRGVSNACLEDPTTFYPSTLPERNEPHTFIYDHRASMSFCTNPIILNNPLKRHGYFAHDVPRPNQAIPYFVQSQTSAGGALLHPALQSYVSPTEYVREYGEITPWSNRTNKVFWRGRTTGEWFSRQHNWRYSHRIRLHLLTNPNGTTIDPNVSSDIEVLVEGGSRQNLHLEGFPRDLFNEKYMDVTLVRPRAVQCDDFEADHTCQEMNTALKWGKQADLNEGLDSKYLLDVDGNGWSSRFQRLLASGAVIFKMTIFPEWNSDWLIPYYHYIPIQTDYLDLYDSIAFFAGTPGGLAGQDKLAERIGTHGHEFVNNHWRWEDMQVYVYRLLLEYARAISEDRDAMTMP